MNERIDNKNISKNNITDTKEYNLFTFGKKNDETSLERINFNK